MTSRFPLAAFKPGMELIVGICHDGGVLLPAGAIVSERHLKQLVAWGIAEVETERPVAGWHELVRGSASSDIVDLKAVGLEATPPKWRPPGHESPDGRIFHVTEPLVHVDDLVRFEKATIIQGSVGPHVRIEAASDLQVDGDVGVGARISAGGDIGVRGEVLGTSERPVTMEGERISVHGARHSRLTARQTISAVDLVRCQARAGHDIHVTGTERGVVAGELEAGSAIRCGTVGGEEDAPAILRVTMARQKQIFQAIVQLERVQAARTEELNQLAKVMEVIRLLGEKVVSLPPEKKQELAIQSKRYMELKAELAEIERKRERAVSETEQDVMQIEQCPIQIGRLLPGIDLVIGAASLKLMARQDTTGYYLKNGRIRALSDL